VTGRWSALLWLSAIGAALPLLGVAHLPFTDLPEHVGAIATLARLLPGGGGAPYELSLAHGPFVVYHALGAILARAIGDAALANRILLAGFAVLWPISLRTLLRALGRDERLAIFGSMLVWNRALAIGFLPFFASVPIAIFALAAIVRQLEAPSIRRGAVAGGLALVLFGTHASTFLAFGVVAGCWTFAIGEGRLSRRLRIAGPALAPAIALALAWWSTSPLRAASGPLDGVAPISLPARAWIAPIWTSDVWRSHVDELCAIAWWLAFAAILAPGLRRPPDRARARQTAIALVPCAVVVVAYLALPFHVGPAGYLSLRLAPLIALFAVAGLRPERGPAGSLPIGVAAAASLVMAGDAAYEMRRVETEELGEGFDAMIGAMRPHTRVVTLDYQTRSPRTHFWPWVFAGAYHRARGGDVASSSFTELAHWPLRYRAGAAPPPHPPFWSHDPCSYRYRADGAYHDYVLVHGPGDPFSGVVPGPVFAEIARSGPFVLYAKSGPDPEPAFADSGPCNRTSTPSAAR
jgi:hypothetical protein